MGTKDYGLPSGAGPEQLVLFEGTVLGTQGGWEPVTLVDQYGTPLGDSIRDIPNEQKTPLAANGTFTGPFTRIDGYGGMFIIWVSNAQPTLVELQWSLDGINPDPDPALGATVLTAHAGGGLFTAVQVINSALRPFYRMNIVNGPTPQSLVITANMLYPEQYAGTFVTLSDTVGALNPAQLVRAVLAGIKPDGSFSNVEISPTNALQVSLENSPASASGSIFTESMRDDVSIDYSVAASLGLLTANLGTGGTATLDSTNGQVVFDTGAAAGNSALFESTVTVAYEPGHTIRGEQTIQVGRLPATATEVVEWGFGDPLNNSVAFRLTNNGMAVIRRRNGVIIDNVAQANWNQDACLAGVNSQFVFAGSPQALNPVHNNLYRIQYKWLGASPLEFLIKSPDGTWVPVHQIQYPNQNLGSSIPVAGQPLYIAAYNDTSVGGSLQVRSGSWRGGLLTGNETKILPLDTWQVKQVPISINPVQLDPVPLLRRKNVQVINLDPNNFVAIGPNSSLNYNNGEPIAPLGSSGMMLSTRSQVWAVTQNTGGIQTTYDRNATVAAGTATNPANAEANDSVDADAANAQTIVLSGYSALTGNAITAMKIGVKGRKAATPATETVAFQDVVTANGAGVTSLSVTPVANANHFYVLGVSRRTTSTVTVVGMGLNWQQRDTVQNGSTQIDLWYAVGTGAVSGAVTVTFSTATNAVIACSRYSNVNFTTPFTAHGTFTGATATVAGSLSATALGMEVIVLNAGTQTVSAPGTGFTTQNDVSVGTGSNVTEEATVTQPSASTGAQAFSITLTGAVAWSACGVTLNPAATITPTVTMTYTVSGVLQATSAVIPLSSTSYASTLTDVTADRPWAQSDIANVQITLTASVVSAHALVDWLYLEVTDTTANTARVAFKEMA